MCFFEPQYSTWATRYTFTTRKAMAILDWRTQPGVSSHIDPNWAVKGADPALHTPCRFRHNLALNNHLPSFAFNI
jgi:hypothetical protein